MSGRCAAFSVSHCHPGSIGEGPFGAAAYNPGFANVMSTGDGEPVAARAERDGAVWSMHPILTHGRGSFKDSPATSDVGGMIPRNDPAPLHRGTRTVVLWIFAVVFVLAALSVMARDFNAG